MLATGVDMARDQMLKSADTVETFGAKGATAQIDLIDPLTIRRPHFAKSQLQYLGSLKAPAASWLL